MTVVAKGQKTITKLDDGYTIRLAPAAIIIPANSDGSNPVLTSAKTRVFLEKAGVNIPLTINSVVGSGCTASFSGIETSITALSAAQGSVTINFTGNDGYVGSVQVSFVVSKQGIGGEDGITILLDNETHALPALFDGTVTITALDTARTKIMVFKGSIQLTAVAANATPGAGQFRYNVDTVVGGTAIRIDNSNVKLATITADQAIINLNIYVESLTKVLTKQMTITKVREGKEGPKGAKGALPLFRGEYNKDEYGNTEVRTYYGTENRSDIVLFNGDYYFTNETAGVFNNIAPNDPGQTKWEAFGSQVSSIATGLLLAQQAYIDNLIVRNIRTAGVFGSVPSSGQRWFELTSADNSYNPNQFRFAVDAKTVNSSWSGDLSLMLSKDNMASYYDYTDGGTKQLAGMEFRKYFSDNSSNPDIVRLTGNGVYSNSSAASALLLTGTSNSAYGAVIGYLRRQESTNPGDINAGVVGIAQNLGANCYAGYFQGRVKIDGDVYVGDKKGLTRKITIIDVGTGGMYHHYNYVNGLLIDYVANNSSVNPF